MYRKSGVFKDLKSNSVPIFKDKIRSNLNTNSQTYQLFQRTRLIRLLYFNPPS